MGFPSLPDTFEAQQIEEGQYPSFSSLAAVLVGRPTSQTQASAALLLSEAGLSSSL